MRILFALDSFKGCLTSAEACAAAAAGAEPGDEIRCIPVSDGGEGLVDVLIGATGGQRISVRVHGPLFEEREAEYGLSQDGGFAMVEVAAASGLPLVPPESRNPLHTTSYGTGELVADALRRGARRIVLGLGGSATNDAGLGLLQALGFRLLDGEGRELPPGATGSDLSKVAAMERPTDLPEFSLLAPCDVRAPLYGPDGAAHVFAPQKGASPEDVEVLDAGLRKVAEVFERLAGGTGRPRAELVAKAPGSGAAGGIGAALLACLGARLVPGIDMVLDAVGLDKALHGADWIVTGEGRSDKQTLMGKVPAGIAERAKRAGVRVALLSGGLRDTAALYQMFDYVASINPPKLPFAEAIRPEVAKENLGRAVAEFREMVGR